MYFRGAPQGHAYRVSDSPFPTAQAARQHAENDNARWNRQQGNTGYKAVFHHVARIGAPRQQRQPQQRGQYFMGMRVG